MYIRYMARLNIDTGAVGNPATGDTLRTAMTKINTNFEEVYQLVGDADTGTITTSITNGDLKLQANGTGIIEIDQLQINNAAITPIATNSDLTLSANGTGTVAVSNLKVDGNIQINDNKIATTVSNSNLQLGANGSGTIELTTQTVSSSSNIIFDAESDIILDAGGKDIIFRYDGVQFGLFTSSGGNLLIQSGTTTMLTGDGANAIFGGNITVPGSSTLDGVTITDNTISANASNSDLVINPSGTGSIKLGGLSLNGTSISSDDSSIININDALNVDGAATIEGTLTTADITTNGTQTITGTLNVDGVTITDNTIKSNASNADLQIGTSGTGVIDVLTATQSTVGSAGGASALPGQPTGYIKIKIGGTLRVIPFYDQA